MFRAELRHVSPNDYASWDTFAAAPHPEPWDEFGWFVLEIGVAGEPETTSFQVLASTPAAVARAKGGAPHRRVLVVDSFEPAALAASLKERVGGVIAPTWDGVVEELRRWMYWEYEQRWS